MIIPHILGGFLAVFSATEMPKMYLFFVCEQKIEGKGKIIFILFGILLT